MKSTFEVAIDTQPMGSSHLSAEELGQLHQELLRELAAQVGHEQMAFAIYLRVPERTANLANGNNAIRYRVVLADGLIANEQEVPCVGIELQAVVG